MSILNAFNDGGPFMYVILAFGIFSLSFIVERGHYLYFKVKESPAQFRESLNQLIQNGDLKAAAKFTGRETSSVARIATIGINELMIGGSEEHVQARMDEQ